MSETLNYTTGYTLLKFYQKVKKSLHYMLLNLLAGRVNHLILPEKDRLYQSRSKTESVICLTGWLWEGNQESLAAADPLSLF